MVNIEKSYIEDNILKITNFTFVHRRNLKLTNTFISKIVVSMCLEKMWIYLHSFCQVY